MDGRNSWLPGDPKLAEATAGRDARSSSHRPNGGGAADVGGTAWPTYRGSSCGACAGRASPPCQDGLRVSDEALNAQNEHPYSEDIADLAG